MEPISKARFQFSKRTTIRFCLQPVAVDMVEREFPFHKFFEDAPRPLFKKRSFEEDLEIAEGCFRFVIFVDNCLNIFRALMIDRCPLQYRHDLWIIDFLCYFRYLEKIFTQLDEFRAFELLRSGLDRSKYLLIMEAKIIAMTCTHAALKRQDLVDLGTFVCPSSSPQTWLKRTIHNYFDLAGFKYDNILMEEAAQILEIETFIPLLLQNPQDGYNRLKRWIMIGDHHQLPPVIKNMAFQKYSNMEQSLFTRIVRIGVPTVDLDCQGRARPR